MKSPANRCRPYRRSLMAAMVLGTALTAIGTSSAAAVSEPTLENISRYCTVCWRNARINPDCWSDCTQEVFVRLLERVPAAGWNHLLQGESQEHREFVRAIDAVKKRRQRQRKYSPLPEEGISEVMVKSNDERQMVDRAAQQVLSPRQQHIMRMSFEGANISEIAQEMQLPPERASDEKYKAVQKLRKHLVRQEIG